MWLLALLVAQVSVSEDFSRLTATIPLTGLASSRPRLEITYSSTTRLCCRATITVVGASSVAEFPKLEEVEIIAGPQIIRTKASSSFGLQPLGRSGMRKMSVETIELGTVSLQELATLRPRLLVLGGKGLVVDESADRVLDDFVRQVQRALRP